MAMHTTLGSVGKYFCILYFLYSMQQKLAGNKLFTVHRAGEESGTGLAVVAFCFRVPSF